MRAAATQEASARDTHTPVLEDRELCLRTLTSAAVFVPQSEWPQVADAVIEARQTIHTHIRLPQRPEECPSRCNPAGDEQAP
jgi:hypothetical protein